VGKVRNKTENSTGANLVKVAGIREIKPGQRKVVSINGQEIALFNLEGEFYAISNRCPHADFPLTFAPVYGDTIICPNHAWMFNVKTGYCMTKSSCVIRTYKVVVEGKDVKIEIYNLSRI
jgi:nitrite reductase/ring-hydroxylating ferredoxin subunit